MASPVVMARAPALTFLLRCLVIWTRPWCAFGNMRCRGQPGNEELAGALTKPPLHALSAFRSDIHSENASANAPLSQP